MKNKPSIIFASILVGLANFNEIFQFIETANKFKEMNWIKVLDAIGTIAIPIMLIYFIWQFFKIKEFFQKELIDYKEYKSYKETAALISSHRDQLFKNLEINTIKNVTSTRALAQFIINLPDSEQKRLANIFYDAEININDLEKIGIKGEIIKTMSIRYHTVKINQQTDESNRIQ